MIPPYLRTFDIFIRDAIVLTRESPQPLLRVGCFAFMAGRTPGSWRAPQSASKRGEACRSVIG